MTPQEAYDTVLFGMRKQKVKSADNNGCLYRDSHGHKCAAGMLMNDEYFEPKFNLLSVDNKFVRKALRKSGVTLHKGKYEYLAELQNAHDKLMPYKKGPMTNWEAEMKQIANKYGFTYTPPKK